MFGPLLYCDASVWNFISLSPMMLVDGSALLVLCRFVARYFRRVGTARGWNRVVHSSSAVLSTVWPWCVHRLYETVGGYLWCVGECCAGAQ